ncbi:MAG: hypothetical protein GVY13_10275 [Alphaproteobacteria bacterium]|jgi:hypothetical protein|nr:hypothetical protein [Alphaproteobacteria bacterium]
MDRAGKFMASIELRINYALQCISAGVPSTSTGLTGMSAENCFVLSWENWLREKTRNEYWWPKQVPRHVKNEDFGKISLRTWLLSRIKTQISLSPTTSPFRKIRGAYMATLDFFFMLALLSSFGGFGSFAYFIYRYVGEADSISGWNFSLIHILAYSTLMLSIIIYGIFKIVRLYKHREDEYDEIRRETYNIE